MQNIYSEDTESAYIMQTGQPDCQARARSGPQKGVISPYLQIFTDGNCWDDIQAHMSSQTHGSYCLESLLQRSASNCDPNFDTVKLLAACQVCFCHDAVE